MVLKDLKKMSISAKTMSLMVASLFAVDGCTELYNTSECLLHNGLQRHDCNTGTSLWTSPGYMTHSSPIPRPKEEEKGPAFSCSRMRIIAVAVNLKL